MALCKAISINKGSRSKLPIYESGCWSIISSAKWRVSFTVNVLFVKVLKLVLNILSLLVRMCKINKYGRNGRLFSMLVLCTFLCLFCYVQALTISCFFCHTVSQQGILMFKPIERSYFLQVDKTCISPDKIIHISSIEYCCIAFNFR